MPFESIGLWQINRRSIRNLNLWIWNRSWFSNQMTICAIFLQFWIECVKLCVFFCFFMCLRAEQSFKVIVRVSNCMWNLKMSLKSTVIVVEECDGFAMRRQQWWWQLNAYEYLCLKWILKKNTSKNRIAATSRIVLQFQFQWFEFK